MHNLGYLAGMLIYAVHCLHLVILLGNGLGDGGGFTVDWGKGDGLGVILDALRAYEHSN